MGEATREVYWNISHIWVMYLLLAPTILVASYGVWRRVRRWRVGQGSLRFDRPWERLKQVWHYAVLQRPIWRHPLSGFFHSSLVWGFVTLTIATTVVFLHEDFDLPIMEGAFYLYFQSLFVDLMGGLALLGVSIATLQRVWGRPARLVLTNEATCILIVLAAILASGFMIEGWRIVATDDPWGVWSPVGYIVGQLSLQIASIESLVVAHKLFWWGHMLLVFGFMAWAPYTKMIHPLTSTLNIFTQDLDKKALVQFKAIDFENDEVFGVNQLKRFAKRELLELDACTECGRCTSVCPANNVGKQLSPRDIILDLRSVLDDAEAALANQANESDGAEDESEAEGTLVGARPALHADALWQCTTCGACVDACPVAIEQFPKLIDLRRFQVMEEADFPRQMQDAVNSIEQRGHPFRGAQASRTDWTEGLEIPQIQDVENPEVLLWVGCGGALVDRNQKSTRALAQLLNHAGVKFGILGKDEACTGDPARRIGNEFLFDTLMQKNTHTLQKLQIKTVITPCPHCFNSFKNEYPEISEQLEVYHHSTYLAKLIGENRLPADAASQEKIALHDPCYLGRHNGEFDAPRAVVDSNTKNRVELPRARRGSFCCGGGGGMSFVDEPAEQRVNRERAREIVNSGVDTVAVACPFCTTMLEDGIGAVQGESNVAVKDIAELMWDAIGQAESPKPALDTNTDITE